MRISKTTLTIITAIFIPTFLLGSEKLGQGIDVFYAFSKIPNTIWRPRESFGFIMATLTINKLYLGVYSCSFLLTTSLSYFFKQAIYKKYFIYLIYIIGISFSWPLFLAATNGLRQGVSISLTILIIAIFKNKGYCSRSFLYLLLIAPFLALSHGYGQLSLLFLFLNFSCSKKFKSGLFTVLVPSLTVPILIYFFRNTITNYTSGNPGMEAQTFLIPILIFYNLLFIFYFRKIDFHQRLSFTLSNSFIMLAIFSFQGSVLSERFLWFPVINLFLTLPEFYKISNPKWLFSILTIITVFIYMCMSLYFVGFKYYE